MPQPQDILKERYQLLEQLGKNMGRQTWLAKDLVEQDEFVVLKLLTFGGDVQWEDLKLFEREAQVLQQLNDPFIPAYRDYFTIDDRSLWFGLVQEYIPGKSLKELLVEGKKFSESQVYEILTDTLEILIYLHELNPPVLHRDIKPSNLILSDAEEIYLVDFGAVQDKAAAEGRTFTVVGTYGYAPMEQYGGGAVAASDLYALGATAIHLLAGISPAELPQDDDMNIQFSDRTSAKPQLVQWLQKMTAPSLKRRFKSAHEALESLYTDPVIFLHPDPKLFLSAIQVPKPNNSPIKLERSPTHLKIIIPSLLGTKIMSSILISVVFGLPVMILLNLIKLSAGAYIAILLIDLVVAFLALGWHYWETICITFDRGEGMWEISKRIFNWHYQSKEFAISDIKYVHNISDSYGDSSAIAIQTAHKKHRIGRSRLSELETVWLTQEIQSWLAAPQKSSD
jgi:serine/threonine protein kinase